jgi:tRNA (guanine-N7-)-methyltransferase
MDIGCARGRFVLAMAQGIKDWNFLGVEIREPLVVEANQIRDRLELNNLHYVFANVNNSLETILGSLPVNSVERITIQYPDPCFKKKHQKRRMVQPELVEAIAKYLAVNGEVFLQSDLEWVAMEMRDKFTSHPAFTLTHQGWLCDNPLAVMTEREIATLNKGLPVYRCLLRKSTITR